MNLAFLTLMAACANLTDAAPRLKTTLMVLADNDVPVEVASRLEREMLLALQLNHRLKIASIETLLSQFASSKPPADLARARSSMSWAETRMWGRSAWLAARRMSLAFALMEKHIEHVKKSELARTQFLLARTLMVARQYRAAVETLVKLLVWRPSYRVEASRCPAWCRGWVDKARRRVQKLGNGRLSLSSAPPGAKVFLDGVYRGVTPVRVTAVMGVHYLTVTKTGYRRMVTPIKFQEDGSRKVELVKTRQSLILDQAGPRIRTTVGRPRASTSIQDLRKLFLLDQVVVARLSESGGRYQVTFFLYDLRTNLLLRKLTKSFSKVRAGPTSGWARSLYARLEYDGSIPDPGDRMDRELTLRATHKKTPLFRKWWFWTAVGVTIVGILVPLSYGLATRNRGRSIVPEGHSPVVIDF